VTADWPSSDVEPVMFLVEIRGARASNALDLRSSHEDVMGPSYTSDPGTTAGNNELLVAIHQSSSRSAQAISFASGETTVDAQLNAGSWTGAIGSRRLVAAGPTSVATTQTAGTSAVVSLVTLFAP
jgi:hypothetical protein